MLLPDAVSCVGCIYCWCCWANHHRARMLPDPLVRLRRYRLFGGRGQALQNCRGFGGFSIIFQVLSCLKHNPLSMSKVVLVRVLHAVLSYIYCEIALKFVDINIPVINNATPVLKTTSSNFLFSISLMFLLVVFLSFLNKSIEN